MNIKNQQDFWSGVLYIAVGLGFSWGATSYSFGSAARPGPGYFPFGLGLLLAMTGAFVLIGSLASKHEGPIGKIAWRPLCIIIGSIILFGFALPYLGMVIALPLLVLTSAFAGDEFHLGEVLLNAAILTLGSWAVFIYGLSLVIPVWPNFIG